MVLRDVYRAQEVVEEGEREGKEKKRGKVEPNRELIRLLKKERLNKELHEDALGEAI